MISQKNYFYSSSDIDRIKSPAPADDAETPIETRLVVEETVFAERIIMKAFLIQFLIKLLFIIEHTRMKTFSNQTLFSTLIRFLIIRYRQNKAPGAWGRRGEHHRDPLGRGGNHCVGGCHHHSAGAQSGQVVGVHVQSDQRAQR